MNKHTPGPWFAGDGPIPDAETCDPGVISVGPFAASIHYEDTIAEVWAGEHDAVANARLIAVAPDLLQALKDARRRLNQGTHWTKILQHISDTLETLER